MLKTTHNAIYVITNIGEAAGLLSVAVNFHELVTERCVDEDRLRPTPPSRVLPRDVTAEEAHHHDRQTKFFLISETEMLVIHLGDSIGPALNAARPHPQVALLMKRDIGITSIHI